MNKEKTILFRVDSQLYNVIQSFAKEKGYENISELMRELIIMHFMGLMLGYFQNKNIETIMVDFIEKYKNINEKNLNAGDTIQSCVEK